MNTVHAFAIQFRFNQLVILKGIEDLSHEECLWSPPQGGNCINFLVGHILASRANLLALLKVAPFWSKEKCLPYVSGANPVAARSALDIRELEQAVVDSLPLLQSALETVDLEQLDPEQSPLWVEASTFVTHEAYHAGQIHLVRRLLGRERCFG